VLNSSILALNFKNWGFLAQHFVFVSCSAPCHDATAFTSTRAACLCISVTHVRQPRVLGFHSKLGLTIVRSSFIAVGAGATRRA